MEHNIGTLPKLSDKNLPIPGKDDHSNPNLELVLEVTADCMTRLYSSLYLLGQPYRDRFNEQHPETCVLYKHAIMQQFLPEFVIAFPDFEQFDVDVKNNGTLVGLNPFTNTILHFLQQLVHTPINPENALAPDLVYTPSLPQQSFSDSDLDNDIDGEYDYDDDESLN